MLAWDLNLDRFEQEYEFNLRPTSPFRTFRKCKFFKILVFNIRWAKLCALKMIDFHLTHNKEATLSCSNDVHKARVCLCMWYSSVVSVSIVFIKHHWLSLATQGRSSGEGSVVTEPEIQRKCFTHQWTLTYVSKV